MEQNKMKVDLKKKKKVCSKCKRELPIEKFGKNKNATDGLQWYCKECARAYFNSKPYLLKHKTAENPMFNSNRVKINSCRNQRISDSRLENGYSFLIYVDKVKTKNMDTKTYQSKLRSDWGKQQRMAIKGKPSAKFLNGEYKPLFVFCFKMEKMLDMKVHISGGKTLYEIEKWWQGKMEYWTIFDQIWR